MRLALPSLGQFNPLRILRANSKFMSGHTKREGNRMERKRLNKDINKEWKGIAMNAD